MPFIPVTQAHLSNFGGEETHVVTGVFADPNSVSSGSLKAFGAIQEPTELDGEPLHQPALRIPALSRLDSAFFLDRYVWGAFASRASFAGVKRLYMQRSKSKLRCMGLLAEFEGYKPPVTLGQWDSGNTQSIVPMYDAQINAPLHNITFVFSEGRRNERYVKNILLNQPDTSEDHFGWDDLSTVRFHLIASRSAFRSLLGADDAQEIAWFFTCYYDHFDIWTGADMEVKLTDSVVEFKTVE